MHHKLHAGCLLLTTIAAPLTCHRPSLTTHYSLLTTHYSLLATRHSLLATRYSLLATHCSLLTTHYTLLSTLSSLLTTLSCAVLPALATCTRYLHSLPALGVRVGRNIAPPESTGIPSQSLAASRAFCHTPSVAMTGSNSSTEEVFAHGDAATCRQRSKPYGNWWRAACSNTATICVVELHDQHEHANYSLRTLSCITKNSISIASSSK